MKFRTEIRELDVNVRIDFQTKITMMGSCFTTNIGAQLNRFQFNTVINPFNIVFNPLSLCHQLKGTIGSDSHFINQREKVCSLDFHSKYNGATTEAFIDKISQSKNELAIRLKETDVLILTFGTAWVYRYKETGKVIANCQKQNANAFQKELLTSKELENDYTVLFDSLVAQNCDLKILLTVSPVRHLKDGLIHNNRSKAVLLSLCHFLESNYPDNVVYYPSYEIVIDDLRDYRFYGSDLLHPNGVAIDYIFEHFKRNLMSDQTNATIRLIHKFNQLSQHEDLQSSEEEKNKRAAKLLDLKQQIARLKLS